MLAKSLSTSARFKTAVYEKASCSLADAWLPIFLGQDAAFGKATISWLTKIWYRTGNIVGPTLGIGGRV